MSTVLISYDLNSPGQKYEALYKEIEGLGASLHVLDSTWLVAGDGLTAQKVYERLKPALDKGDHVFCVDVAGQRRQGWLPKARWDWIRKYL